MIGASVSLVSIKANLLLLCLVKIRSPHTSVFGSTHESLSNLRCAPELTQAGHSHGLGAPGKGCVLSQLLPLGYLDFPHGPHTLSCSEYRQFN